MRGKPCALTAWHSPVPSSVTVSGQEVVPGWAWGGICWDYTDPWAGLASPVGTPSLLVSPCAPVPSLNSCLPSPASWSTVEQSLIKLGENLNNLGSSPLRSQADDCVSLIKRWLCAAAPWAQGAKWV